MRKIATLAVTVLAAGMVVAGCGGDDDETTTSTLSTTTEDTGATGGSGESDVSPERAALIAEADAICAEGDEEIDAAAAETFQGDEEPSTADQEAFVEDTVVPSIQDQLDGLSELDPPEADAEEFQSIIDDAQSALDELEANPGALTDGSDDPFADVNAQAEEFGLTKCGGD